MDFLGIFLRDVRCNRLWFGFGAVRRAGRPRMDEVVEWRGPCATLQLQHFHARATPLHLTNMASFRRGFPRANKRPYPWKTWYAPIFESLSANKPFARNPQLVHAHHSTGEQIIPHSTRTELRSNIFNKIHYQQCLN